MKNDFERKRSDILLYILIFILQPKIYILKSKNKSLHI